LFRVNINIITWVCLIDRAKARCFRLSRHLPSSYDALASYIQWFVASGRDRQDGAHEAIVTICSSRIDGLVSAGDHATALTWCDAIVCLCQQAEDHAATEAFVARKLSALLELGDVETANKTITDFDSVVKKEVLHNLHEILTRHYSILFKTLQNSVFAPILLRLAAREKNFESAEKLIAHVADTKDAVDCGRALLGFFLEGSSVMQMSDMARMLEKLLVRTNVNPGKLLSQSGQKIFQKLNCG
jgi:hypothetical protein